MLVYFIFPNIINKFLNFCFTGKLRSIGKFQIKNQFCALLGGQDFYKTKRCSGIDKCIFILTWSGSHWNTVALRWPNWLLTGPVMPWEALMGPQLPRLVSQGVSGPLKGPSRHLKATLILWGPFQANMNMYLSISENWFCLVNILAILLIFLIKFNLFSILSVWY